MKEGTQEAISKALEAADRAAKDRESADREARRADTTCMNAKETHRKACRELGKTIAAAVWLPRDSEAFRNVLQGMLDPIEGRTCRTDMDDRRKAMKAVAVPICEEPNSRAA